MTSNSIEIISIINDTLASSSSGDINGNAVSVVSVGLVVVSVSVVVIPVVVVVVVVVVSVVVVVVVVCFSGLTINDFDEYLVLVP